MKMKTNMNELSLNEMEQVNGGSVTLAVIGLVSACVTLGIGVTKFGMKIYKDIKGDD